MAIRAALRRLSVGKTLEELAEFVNRELVPLVQELRAVVSDISEAPPPKDVHTLVGPANDLTPEHVDGYVTVDSAAPATLGVPLVLCPVGRSIEVFQLGAGQVTLVAAPGVTLLSPSTTATAAQHSTIRLFCAAEDEYHLSGGLA